MASNQKRRTTRPKQQLRKRILVVTEGAVTECQYVDKLNAILRSKGATAIAKSVSVGKDPFKVVQKCLELRDEAVQNDKGYDYCVCLVDVDEHTTMDAAIELAERESVQLLISNLKFEVWLRWHAEDKNSALTSKQLDELVAKLGLVKLAKNGKHLSQNFPFKAVDDACRIARAADPGMRPGRRGPNPSSSLPILVDLMQR